MKQETFFEKFDLFADAPGAVAKMRELVLELAIKGKLVAQSSDDEPAFKQLERIAAKKSRTGRVARVKAGKGGGRSDAPEKTKTPTPDGWTKASLAELVSVLNGRAYSKDELLDAGTPVLRVGNLFTSKHWYYSNLELVPDKYCHEEDLIFAWSASFGPFIWPGPKVIYHYHIWKLELHSEADLHKGFLYWFLQNKTQEIKRAGHGVSMLHMTKEKMEKLEVMLPPLAEQKRIVAKVDELMALCDRLEAQQQERETRHAAVARASLARFADAPTPANLDFLFHSSFSIQPSDLRKSILTLAVQGKLVPKDTNDEPAIALLDQIAAHKAALAKEGKLRGSTSVKPMAGDEAEFEIPSNWCWVRFGQIMVNRDGERIPVSKEEREIKAKIYDYYGASGIIDKIDGYLFDKPLLLIGEDGANLINRSTPIAFIARGKYWVNNHAHVLDGISEDFLQFIKLHINAINLEKYITGSAQPKMNQAKMNSIPIALPPLAEQRRIVAKVDQLMALVDALETQLSASRASAANLLEALVAELTAQV